MFRRGTERRPADGEQAQAPEAGRPEAPAARPETGAVAVAGVPADWANWGSILAGTVAGLAVLSLLSILGTGLDIEVIETAGVSAFGEVTTSAGIWGVATFGAAMLIGAYLGGLMASVGGLVPGAITGAVIWALSLVGLTLLAGIDAGPLFGLVGKVFSDIGLVFGTTPADAGVTVSNDGAWWTIVALVVGLGAAVLGGAAGGMTPRRTTRMRY